MQIVATGEWTGPQLRENGIVEKHYGVLAQRALHDDPATLACDWGEFDRVFGLEPARMLNLTEARKELGLNDTEMTAAWRAGPYVKLLPGTYVAKVGDIFVVNGFYGDMVSSWLEDDAKVGYYVVQWREEDLSWKDFRLRMIGVTDPSKAAEGSIRSVLWRDYESRFGLETPPNLQLNGVHASAGPIEGARECEMWAQCKSSLRAYDIPEEIWERAMNNCDNIFDSTEGMSVTEGVEVLRSL